MKTSLTSKNWKITRFGALTVIILAISFLGYSIQMVDSQSALIIAGIAGLLFGLSGKFGDIEKLKSISRPISGFLGMGAGFLFILAYLTFLEAQVELLFELFDQYEDFPQLMSVILMTFSGYLVALFGVFLATTGSVLVYWDEAGEKTPLGTGKRDFLFTGVLISVTALSVFGSAVLTDYSLNEGWSLVEGIFVDSNDIPGITTAILILITYKISRLMGSELPTRALVPEKRRDLYDKVSRLSMFSAWLASPLLALLLVFSDFVDLSELRFIEILATESIRQFMVNWILFGVFVIILVNFVKFATRDRDKIRSLYPFIVFGLTAYVMAFLMTGYVSEVIAQLPPEMRLPVSQFAGSVGDVNFVMILLILASILSVFLNMLISFIRSIGMIPKGLEGVTLVSASLFFTSIGVYLYSQESIILFMGVAISVVTWEIGRRSVVLGKEVGREAPTLSAEAVQTAFKLATVSIVGFSVYQLHQVMDPSGIITGALQELLPMFIALSIGFILLVMALKTRS